MANLKDDFLNEDSNKIISSIKEHFDKTFKPVKKKLDHIYEYMKNNFPTFEPLSSSQSLKKITQKGYEILKRHNTDIYLATNCELLKNQELKSKSDVEIFIECLNWVKKEGKIKAIEIRLHCDYSQEQCNELLALFIMEKIKKTG